MYANIGAVLPIKNVPPIHVEATSARRIGKKPNEDACPF